jgi:6-phosphofructo-2-kinase/fructose-2,6-biphosphatase
LNEINAGDFDGLSYEDIAEMDPVEFAKRDQDKLRYRYPNGESYIDVCRSALNFFLEMFFFW